MTSTAVVVAGCDHVHSVLGFLFAVHRRKVPRVAERRNGRNLRYTALPFLPSRWLVWVAIPISIRVVGQRSRVRSYEESERVYCWHARWLRSRGAKSFDFAWDLRKIAAWVAKMHLVVTC